MVNVSNKALLTFLYFIQGIPYGLQTQFLPIYLYSKASFSTSQISLFKLLSFPWIFKFAWGPLIDSFSTKRRWLYIINLMLGVVCLIGALVTPSITIISSILFLLNLFASIQDVVVDATTISLLTIEEFAVGNIAQVVGYKLGSIFSGGIITLFIHDVGWKVLFCVIATFYVEAAMLVFVSPTLCSHERQELDESRSIFTCKAPSFIESDTKKDTHTSSFFTDVFSEQGTIWLLMFLLVYKLGEQGALSILPMYLLDVGISADDVTLWISIVGQALSIAGSIMGGIIIKFTRRVPTEFLLQQLCMLRLLPVGCQLLMVIAWDHKLLSKHFLLCALVVSSQLLLLISGIVTTTTFTLIMEISKRVPKRVQATHYAMTSTIEVLGKLMFVSTSGWIVDATSYNVAFLLFVFLNILVLPLFAKLPKRVSKIDNLQKPQVDLKIDKKL